MDTPDANSQPPNADRRNAERLRALKSAKLISGGFSATVVDCLLIEISEIGARVETAVMMHVPEFLALRLSDNTERQARRCWAVGNEIGLAFLPGTP
jgi:hypothetical protein